jgi:GxxExxY protein
LELSSEVLLPVIYKDHLIDLGYRLDLLVACEIIVELKAVEQLAAVHKAQLLTYLKLTHKRLGLLINFNVPLIKDGIHRLIL